MRRRFLTWPYSTRENTLIHLKIEKNNFLIQFRRKLLFYQKVFDDFSSGSTCVFDHFESGSKYWYPRIGYLIGSYRLFPMCDFFCPWNWRCEINQDHYYREDWNHQTNHWKYSKIWLSTLRGSIFRLNELGYSNINFFYLDAPLMTSSQNLTRVRR